MSDEKGCREAFEAWHKQRFVLPLVPEEGGYKHPTVNERWTCFQAGRATRPAPQVEDLVKALEPFAAIPLLRDLPTATANDPDMIDAPDLAIAPSDVRRARAALAAYRKD